MRLIDDLNVGDRIGVSPGGWDPMPEIRSVTKKTATQITLDDGSRWTKRGRKVGESESYHGSFLIAVEDAQERRVEALRKRERLALTRELRDALYGKLPTDALREMVEIIKKYSQCGDKQP